MTNLSNGNAIQLLEKNINTYHRLPYSCLCKPSPGMMINQMQKTNTKNQNEFHHFIKSNKPKYDLHFPLKFSTISRAPESEFRFIALDVETACIKHSARPCR